MSQSLLNMPDATVIFLPNPVLGFEPDIPFGYDIDILFNLLLREVPWEQRNITIHGREIPQPRLVAWYGEYGYKYSGLQLLPKPFNPVLQNLTNHMEWLTGIPYNGILMNLYKNGQSSIGMHSDNEPEFGPNPTIASLSLGSARTMTFEHIDKQVEKRHIHLTHGSLLIMGGSTQAYWKHGISKTKENVGPRINLTFRHIKNPQ